MHPTVRNPAPELVLDVGARRAGLAMSLFVGAAAGGLVAAVTAKKIGATAVLFPIVGVGTAFAAWGLTWASGYDPRGLA